MNKEMNDRINVLTLQIEEYEYKLRKTDIELAELEKDNKELSQMIDERNYYRREYNNQLLKNKDIKEMIVEKEKELYAYKKETLLADGIDLSDITVIKEKIAKLEKLVQNLIVQKEWTYY